MVTLPPPMVCADATQDVPDTWMKYTDTGGGGGEGAVLKFSGIQRSGNVHTHGH